MNAILAERVCIVTGSARGIGAEMAVHFARLGARVVVTDRSSCSDTIRRIRQDGGLAVEVIGDVTRATDADAIVSAALDAYDGIDVLLNNAALYGGIKICGFEHIAEDEWDAMMAINVKGVWQMCRAAASHMRGRGGGRIINVSSNVIFMGKPGFLHYVASKGAVWALTNGLSRELAGTGITVNALAPGYTITEATRSMSTPEKVRDLEEQILNQQSVKRLIEPDDLTGIAAFLASGSSSMVTGQTFTVDGGTVTR